MIWQQQVRHIQMGVKPMTKLQFEKKCCERCKKSNTNGGTRTLNLSLRRGAPYPLGHVGRTAILCPLFTQKANHDRRSNLPKAGHKNIKETHQIFRLKVSYIKAMLQQCEVFVYVLSKKQQTYLHCNALPATRSNKLDRQFARFLISLVKHFKSREGG